MKQLLILLFLVFSINLYAEEFGVIKGKITDKNTGQSLVGVNINIVNSKLGAATNINGKYVIKNVPIGKHILKATSLGYAQQQKEIEVKAGLLSRHNFQLLVSKIETEEVMVMADKPLMKS